MEILFINDIEIVFIFMQRELKLNIKRIDETNYVSILSPHSLKVCFMVI